MSATRFMLVVLLLIGPGVASALEEISFDDGRSLSLGALARAGAVETEGTKNPVLGFGGAVLALNAQLDPALRFQLNAAASPGAGGVSVLDAIAELEPLAELKVWAGLLLPASDRLSLTGPYFSALWDAPFVDTYAGSPSGRTPGATLWGRLAGERVRYQLGAYEGVSGLPGPLLAGRIQLDLLDREPGYYCAGTYLGERQILSLGVGGRTQNRGAGGPNEMSVGNVDLLAESALGHLGVGTLEAEALDYDLGGSKNPTLLSGLAGEVTAAWLLPWRVGVVQLQPAARWEEGHNPLGAHHERVDATINALAFGQSLRVALEGSLDRGAAQAYSATLGVQVVL